MVARYFVLVMVICVSPTLAASQKEVRVAAKDKFEITKRALSGEVSRVGTVVYLKTPGVTAERPVMAVKTLAVINGEVQANDVSRDPSRVELSVGEPMHVYGIQVKKTAVRLQLGTEAKYPVRFMGQTIESHLQTALEFKIDEGYANSTVEEVLDSIAAAVVTETEASQQPELLSAATKVRQRHADAAEQRRQEQQQVAATVTTGGAPSSSGAAGTTATRSPGSNTNTPSTVSGSDRQRQTKNAAQLRTEELRKLADEAYAEKWDAQLASSEPWVNPADLLRYSPARTMAALAQGHRIHFTAREIAFSSGSMTVQGSHRYTNIYEGIEEQVEREFGRRSGDYWENYFNSLQAATKDRYVSFVCMIDPAEAAGLEIGEEYIVSATLEDYRDGDYSAPQALLTCTDIVQISP